MLSILPLLFTVATALVVQDVAVRDAIRARDTACNNSPALCSRSYSAITHLGAHDSPFVRDSSTGFSVSGNQYYNSTVQLSAGVRLLSAQVHKNNGQWHLCHSSCDLLDAGTLGTWLTSIAVWLESNPNDVVTILLVNSDDATVADLDAVFQEAQVTDIAYKPASQSPPASWPTLQELINANTRLMVFVASLDVSTITSSTSYLMDEFTFIFENPYDNTSPTDFTCTPQRPSGLSVQSAVASNRMPFMNHFLYSTGALDIETPDVENITVTNNPETTTVGMLGNALASCNTAYGRNPTFVLVDFFDEGPAIQAVDSVNGITAVGRTALPSRDSSTSRADSAFAQVGVLVDQAKEGKSISKAQWIWAGGKWTLGGINVSGKGSVVG